MNIEKIIQLQNLLITSRPIPHLIDEILSFYPQLGFEFGAIFLKTKEEADYFNTSLPGQANLEAYEKEKLAEHLFNQAVIKKTLQGNTPKIINNAKTVKRWLKLKDTQNRCQSAVIYPFHSSKAAYQGLLIFGSQQHDFISATIITWLKSITWQVNCAIENILLYQNETQRLMQFDLINEASQAATSVVNYKQMMGKIAQMIYHHFNFHKISIYRVMPENVSKIEQVVCIKQGEFVPQEKKQRLVDEDEISVAVTNGKTFIANNLIIKKFFSSDNLQIKARLFLPIRFGSKIIGILKIDSVTPYVFNQATVYTLEILCNQLAVVIENMYLYNELNDTFNELLSLNHISQSVSSSLDFQETLTLITQHVTVMLNVAATSIALVDKKQDNIWFAAASGHGAKTVLTKRLDIGQGIIGWVTKTGKAIIVRNAYQDERFFPLIDEVSGFKTHNILCVPLKTKGTLIGAIEAINKKDGDFTPQDLNRLSALTAPAATAIENAYLHQQLNQHMTELKETQAQLIQNGKLSAIGQLAAGVAHELNNPLTSIISLSKILHEDLQPYPEVVDDLAIIVEEADRAKKIVRALLDFARENKPNRNPTDLNMLIKSAIFLILTEHIRQQIDIIEHLQTLPVIRVDDHQIKQVLINILNNAIQSMPNGGQITISTIFNPITSFIQISIADEGGGIPLEYEDKIFNPFFTTKEVGQGTGLGLSVSYGIIERHRGTIEIENQPGKGTIFRILLPVA